MTVKLVVGQSPRHRSALLLSSLVVACVVQTDDFATEVYVDPFGIPAATDSPPVRIRRGRMLGDPAVTAAYTVAAQMQQIRRRPAATLRAVLTVMY